MKRTNVSPGVRRRKDRRPRGVRALGTHPWEALRVALSKEQRGILLEEMELPVRVRGYVEREGLTTLGALAARSAVELSSAGNFGGKSLTALVHAITTDRIRVERDRALFERGLLQSFEALLAPLPAKERATLLGRAGLYDGRASLERLGDELGLTKERVRQIELVQCRALSRRRGWANRTRSRLESALAKGAEDFEVLRKGRWWARATRYPSFIEFVARTIFGIDAHVVEFSGVTCFSRWPMARLQRVAKALRRQALALPTPTPRSSVDALTRRVAGALGPLLERLLARELSRLLHVRSDSRGRDRVVAIGHSQRARILSILAAEPAPIRSKDLFERLGTQTGWRSDELVYFGRHRVGLASHFPGFARWQARLGPAALEVMRRLRPNRQWSAAELLEELARHWTLPPALNRTLLSSLLRQAPGLRYLGRGRFVLEGRPFPRRRIYVHEAVAKLLRQAGKPLRRKVLIERLQSRMGTNVEHLSMVLKRPEFVRLADGRIGLRSRDATKASQAGNRRSSGRTDARRSRRSTTSSSSSAVIAAPFLRRASP